MSILNDINELVKAGVITRETGDKIQLYYKNRSGSSTNKLFIIFGILGALLVGLGILLIIAHNWDELSRITKTIFAFLPLLIGQILCAYARFKRPNNVAWREGGSSFLILSVGASISLVSQIYHIPGDLSSFLLTWMLLSLPVIYVMRSSMASLLYLAGITYFACEISYWSYPTSESYLYWLLLLSALPHYYLLFRNKPKSNFMIFHNWIIPISLIITLGTVAKDTEELMFVAYFSIFGLLYLVGDQSFFTKQKFLNNGYKLFGSLGTIVLLLVLSFDWFWEELQGKELLFIEILKSPEFIASAIITLMASGLLYINQKNRSLKDIKPISLVFILFVFLFILGRYPIVSMALINISVFVIGLLTIRDGLKQDHLGVLNYGLLIITALVVCRFFDANLSFIFRGIMFMSVGVGFFVANYWMLKKRKRNEA